VSGAGRRWLQRLGLLALGGSSTLLALGASEVALRVLGYEPIYSVYSHPEIFWRRDDLLGWSHEPNSEGVYVGPRPWPVEFEAPVRINSLGLRGPEVPERSARAYRVMLLGDSMVAGFEVPWERSFPALLEAQLNAEFEFPVEIINAGVRGYGTDQSYLYFKERGRRLEPDLVIHLHGGNDPADNVTLHRMRRTFSKGGLALRAQGGLELAGYPIPEYPLCSEWLLDSSFRPRRVDTPFESAMCGVQTRLSDRSALFTFVSLRLRQNPKLLVFFYQLGSPRSGAESMLSAQGEEASDFPEVAPRRELSAAILRALAREVRASGAEPMFLVIPSFWVGIDPRDFASEGVTLCEVADDLERAEYHYEHDSHLNLRGHELLAERLRPAVAERIRARRAAAARAQGD